MIPVRVAQGNHLFEVDPRFNPLDSRDISLHNDMLAVGVISFCQMMQLHGASFHRFGLETYKWVPKRVRFNLIYQDLVSSSLSSMHLTSDHI